MASKVEVDLIASGYEWTCPHCDTLNKVVETTKKVTCGKCKRQYNVADYAHAIGDD